MSLERKLLAIEETFWRGGPDAYHQHCDEECLVVFAEMARVMSQADIAKSAEEGRWHDVSMKPKGMVKLADTAAIVTYECDAKRKDGRAHRALVSSGYVSRPDGWKLAFHQQTVIK
jgi:hypothetical protein